MSLLFSVIVFLFRLLTVFIHNDLTADFCSSDTVLELLCIGVLTGCALVCFFISVSIGSYLCTFSVLSICGCAEFLLGRAVSHVPSEPATYFFLLLSVAGSVLLMFDSKRNALCILFSVLTGISVLLSSLFETLITVSIVNTDSRITSTMISGFVCFFLFLLFILRINTQGRSETNLKDAVLTCAAGLLWGLAEFQTAGLRFLPEGNVLPVVSCISLPVTLGVSSLLHKEKYSAVGMLGVLLLVSGNVLLSLF